MENRPFRKRTYQPSPEGARSTFCSAQHSQGGAVVKSTVNLANICLNCDYAPKIILKLLHNALVVEFFQKWNPQCDDNAVSFNAPAFRWGIHLFKDAEKILLLLLMHTTPWVMWFRLGHFCFRRGIVPSGLMDHHGSSSPQFCTIRVHFQHQLESARKSWSACPSLHKYG